MAKGILSIVEERMCNVEQLHNLSGIWLFWHFLPYIGLFFHSRFFGHYLFDDVFALSGH